MLETGEGSSFGSGYHRPHKNIQVLECLDVTGKVTGASCMKGIIKYAEHIIRLKSDIPIKQKLISYYRRV